MKKLVRSQVPPGASLDIGETWCLDATSFRDGFRHRVHKVERGFEYHVRICLGSGRSKVFVTEERMRPRDWYGANMSVAALWRIRSQVGFTQEIWCDRV